MPSYLVRKENQTGRPSRRLYFFAFGMACATNGKAASVPPGVGPESVFPWALAVLL